VGKGVCSLCKNNLVAKCEIVMETSQLIEHKNKKGVKKGKDKNLSIKLHIKGLNWRLISKHLERFPSEFGSHLISMNIPLRKE
jgi:hypothetical protein